MNYVHNNTIWNRNETRVDEIFAYVIAVDILNEEVYVPKTPEECMHIIDVLIRKSMCLKLLKSVCTEMIGQNGKK